MGMDKTSQPQYKNVVIVGAVSGTWAVRYLQNRLPKDYRLVVIDRQQELFLPIPALRAAVVPGWEEKVFAPFEGMLGKGSRHITLPGTEVVELKERSVVVDAEPKEKGLSYEIPFEYCILAMGASQSTPARPAGRTGKEISEYLKQTQKTIASSSNVLVIGGGPAAIEFSTEVRERHPNVGVTLVQRSDKLARGAPGVHAKVLPVLRQMGIEVILEDQVVWPEGYIAGETTGEERVFKTLKGREIKAGYVFDATGNKANSGLVFAVDPAAVAKNGCVRVKPTLEVDSPKLQYYFAMGDLADVQEIKLLGASRRHAATISTNLLSRLASRPATKKHSPRPNAGNITLGTKNGLIYNPIWTFTGWLVSFSQGDLHASQFQRMYTPRGGMWDTAATVVVGIIMVGYLVQRFWL